MYKLYVLIGVSCDIRMSVMRDVNILEYVVRMYVHTSSVASVTLN
jgi:hypothetical protein